MKKLLSTLSAIMIIVSMTACSSNANGNNGRSENTDSSYDSSESDNGSNPEKSDELLKKIEEFPVDEIELPDGSKIGKSAAVGFTEDGALLFDFAYIRYAEPVFLNTFDDESVFDWENWEFTEIQDEAPDMKWIRVQTGDILENGARLSKTQSTYYYYDEFMGGSMNCAIDIDGEVTMNGILTKLEEDWAYGSQTTGDLMFYPDPTDTRIPVLYENKPDDMVSLASINSFYKQILDPVGKFALLYDGDPLFLGNISDTDIEFDENAARVSVTLKNIKQTLSATNGGKAEIVSVN